MTAYPALGSEGIQLSLPVLSFASVLTAMCEALTFVTTVPADVVV